MVNKKWKNNNNKAEREREKEIERDRKTEQDAHRNVYDGTPPNTILLCIAVRESMVESSPTSV